MADIYELFMALDLREGIPDEEVAELRWHLGLGDRPEGLRTVAAFPDVAEDGDGEVVEDRPEPLMAGRGRAWKIGGALVSLLEQAPGKAWALTVRQELHPDDFDLTGELLRWLAGQVDDRHCGADGAVHLGWTRFFEADRFESLVVREGEVLWP
ncbi:hypothetical protein [Streptomyces sp. SID9124]|uniref:hypothetical protein n=1 Tax=Streptomyces sp. SID9124 TaxID=2706108 RepID=UPI0013DED13E|nr:hypothetical protein [Streptomyces sp. SID9124]NED14578.1 hypothetical protein [Streptomyces sp. SID9124]